ncbi:MULTISPECIES: DUF6228 family protein [unclassified Streptomyces]|uniref:DUF6228 family protein n=1 Tax=unclassified Streptomyces TaxID=2593676 RepID=UPI002E30A5E0|nr:MULTISPECIES: DUF6228 family protein [unclassified Streptomyces]WUC62828.1 DUF6228 family protein [Streptomyces sp. NBC_00539]
MRTHDSDLDTPTVVTVRCRNNHSVSVRLRDPSRPDGDRVQYAVEASAPGLTARVDPVVAWNWGTDLAPFLEGLAADFRGWDGQRDWQTNDHDLTISAVFRSGGHVRLTWTLRPWRSAAGGWEASVTTWLDAGEQMSALAVDVRRFLTQQDGSRR